MSGDDNSVEFIHNFTNTATGSDLRNGGAGPSTVDRSRQITFNIHYNYETHRIKLSDQATLCK